MSTYTIDFEPVGRRGQCQGKESLLDCAHRFGVGISSVCGGHGTCCTCKIKILNGIVSKPTASEQEAFSLPELEAGWRLACQVWPGSDLRLNVPPESMNTLQRTQLEGLEIKVSPEPAVKAYDVKLPVPSLADSQADAERLLTALNQQHQVRCDRIDINVLRRLSHQLRAWDWQCQVAVRHGEVIAVTPWSGRCLGLAVDLGTTKIAGYLVDLNSGQTLAAKGMMNPQISYGEDVITRITAVINSPEAGVQLQKLTVQALNELVAELCTEVRASREQIVEAVVVCNTAMHHLFLGLPARQLALHPFVPAVSSALDVKAGDVHLDFSPGAYVHLLPNIAGFVGADHVAMLLATDAWQAEGPIVALDIGTNTEVSLVNNGRITAVSCASGPAFEGGHIKDGMRAARGAIEHFRIKNDVIDFQTIEDAPPIGICGSGILDVVAQLYLAGIIDQSGRMKANHPRVHTRKKQRQFLIVDKQEQDGHPQIVITQQDVRELQLAKAAIRTGIQTLLEMNRCSEQDIKQVIIAGAFGSYIDVSSAITIGMLPSLPLERFCQVGNAAGMGAKLALISLSQRAQAQAIAARVNYLELSTIPDFKKTFVQATYLGQYRMTQGKREEIN